MIKINANDLVNSKEFVREPVDIEVNNILESSSNKIILTGEKGSGKSTVLCSLEKRGLGSKEQTIKIAPEGVMSLSTREPNKVFNRDVFDTFYELSFARDILRYIKSNYPILARKCFAKENEKVYSLTKSFYTTLNNAIYLYESKFDTKVNTKELSYSILRDLRRLLEVEKLNLSIDRFDDINGSSEYVQQIYKRYFDMFDKVMIVSDDPNLNNEKLIEKGYEIRKIEYGSSKEVLREIIKRRIQSHNDNNVDKMNEDLFTQDIFIDKLINQGNNSITRSLDILYITNHYLNFEGSNSSFEKIIDDSIKYEKERVKKLERIIKPPTLYL